LRAGHHVLVPLLILPEPGAANFRYVIKSLKVWPRTHDGNMMLAKAHSLEESWEIKLGPYTTIFQLGKPKLVEATLIIEIMLLRLW